MAYRDQAEHEPEHVCKFEPKIWVDYQRFDFCVCGAMQHAELTGWQLMAERIRRWWHDFKNAKW